MMRRYFPRKKSKQNGQLVVNLAEILVSAGLVVGAGMQAQSLWQSYQYETYYNDLKSVETVLWDFKMSKGHWPGDCDKDGVIDFFLNNDQKHTVASHQACAFSSASQDAMVRLFSELDSVNLLNDPISHLFGSDSNQQMKLAHRLALESDPQNVLVVSNIETDLAKWLDNRVDGSSTANSGRIRLAETHNVGSGDKWPTMSEIDSVNIVYYFDSKL